MRWGFQTAERGCAFDQGKSDAPDTTQFKFCLCGDAGEFKDDYVRGTAGDLAGEFFDLSCIRSACERLGSGHACRHFYRHASCRRRSGGRCFLRRFGGWPLSVARSPRSSRLFACEVCEAGYFIVIKDPF